MLSTVIFIKKTKVRLNKVLVGEFLTVNKRNLYSQWPKQLRNFYYPIEQEILRQNDSRAD